MPQFNTLSEWLSWQETLHANEIDLGLDRIQRVYQRMHDQRLPTVITVAGTNGKGSSVAMLESIYRQQGYRTGTYTSPHLLRYNERIAINGEPQSDRVLIDAFNRVELARQDERLTYFEFGTLAALDVFHRNSLDVVILETGLGGRLDAVNIIDTDAALITTIDLDHQAWLGNDRETIAKEKAGIFRTSKPAISADPESPIALKESAKSINASWMENGVDFSVEIGQNHWTWSFGGKILESLPFPAINGDHQITNAAGALMVIEVLQAQLPVSLNAIQQGLIKVELAGRLQRRSGVIEQILDVSHNEQGVAALAKMLRDEPVAGRTAAVIGMMADKDQRAIITQLADYIDVWFTVDLQTARAEKAQNLCNIIEQLSIGACTACDSVVSAYAQVNKQLGNSDRIVVCGSFYTVAEWLVIEG